MNKLMVAVLSVRDWAGRDSSDGQKDMTTATLLDVNSKQVYSPSFKSELLQDAAFEQGDLVNTVFEVEMIDNGFSKKIASFNRTSKTWEIKVK